MPRCARNGSAAFDRSKAAYLAVFIHDNRIYNTNLSGIWIFGTGDFTELTCGYVKVYNNLIYHTGNKQNFGAHEGGTGGILVCGFDADITNNTIDDCYGFGIGTLEVYHKDYTPPAMTYTINIENNIITRTKPHSQVTGTTGYGIYNPNLGLSGVVHNYVMSYNCLNNANDYFPTTTAHPTDIKEDPMYANADNLDPLVLPLNSRDYHLKSHGGRYNSGSWTVVLDNAVSPCVDAGNPGSDYSREPFYNGDRVNMGRFGNTPEASKSVFRLKSAVADLYLHNTYENLSNPEDNVVQYAGLVSAYDSYKWIFENVGGGYYRIRNYWTGTYLNTENTGTSVHCDHDDFGDAAKWFLEKDSSNDYTFYNKYRKAYMHIEGRLGYAQMGASNTDAYWTVIPVR